jgi:hypothetical protein
MGMGDDISERIEINNEAKINGIPASKAVLMFTDDEGKDIGRFIGYFVVDGNMVYTITFITPPTNYEPYIPIIQKMVDSFKIL